MSDPKPDQDGAMHDGALRAMQDGALRAMTDDGDFRVVDPGEPERQRLEEKS